MKNLIILVALVPVTLCAQKITEAQVPPAVRETFGKTYTDVKSVEWEKQGPDFEAEYKKGGSERTVLMSNDGKVLETGEEIKVSDLPAAIGAYIAANYKGSKIKEAIRITDAQGKITYEAELQDKDLIFDHMGQFKKVEHEDGVDKN